MDTLESLTLIALVGCAATGLGLAAMLILKRRRPGR